MGTHLNCIDKSMQFKWIPTAYAFIKKLTKSTLACNLKTTALLDCVLIGACAVIRSNMVSAFIVVIDKSCLTTLTTLWAFSADDKLMIFFLVFQK